MDNLPAKTTALLKQLEEDYPDRIMPVEQTPYQQGKQHGVIELIRHLKQLQESGD
jgi:hypothetical protein